MDHDKVNILLVDDQPAKLLAYEVILKELGENLAIATSGREALAYLLRNEVAVILVDVCMPELDGFELAAMIRDHPRFRQTAMIFISAIQVSDLDRLRGYEMGAVDYVPVPVVPQVLRAKIRVFTELYRKTRQLERLNAELEDRVRARTVELENSNARLIESEQRRSLAIAAGRMGSWDWERDSGDWMWDEGQFRIFGVDPGSFAVTCESVEALLHAGDVGELRNIVAQLGRGTRSWEVEFRIIRPDGEVRWCAGTAAATVDKNGRVVRVSGVTVDITERKRAEERQNLLTREVDHRAKNALALAQSIVRLTRCDDVKDYVAAVEGRISALARVHTVLSLSSWQGAEIGQLIEEELSPYSSSEQIEIQGPKLQLHPSTDHKFGQIRRALGPSRPARHPMGNPGRESRTLVGRTGRTAGHQADHARIWDKKRDCQRRLPARRARRIRLACRRAAVPALGPPRPDLDRAIAGPRTPQPDARGSGRRSIKARWPARGRPAFSG